VLENASRLPSSLSVALNIQHLTKMVTSNCLEQTKSSKLKKSKHGKHKSNYYTQYYAKNKSKYLLAKQKYQAKLKANKPKKIVSEFQQNKQKQLLKLLVNQKSFVPVPNKLKHPIIKNWNASNYWHSKKLDLNNLSRGCMRIYEDNWNNCYIGWLDVDQKKWTKIAKKYACGYVKSPKGHIRIPFLFKNKNQEKTGTLYYQGNKIGDAKISGEVMLPGNSYYDKNGKFLGYYEYKAWGTFFPKQNYIFETPNEFWELLKNDFGIEHRTISQHFAWQKIIEKMTDCQSFKEIPFTLSREPPDRWKNLNNLSKITNY